MNAHVFENYIGADNSCWLFNSIQRDTANERLCTQKVLYYKRLFKENNNCIIERISSGALSVKELYGKSIENANPELHRTSEGVKLEKFNRQVNTNVSKPTTDMFRCRKCKENKCTYYEQQTRCADEPMTKFIKCCNCGFEWRV